MSDQHSPDLYAVLGVGADATTEELRWAHRRAARDAHPDTGGSADRMALVNQAWACLGDPARRATYDRFVSAARRFSAPDPADPVPDLVEPPFVSADPVRRRLAGLVLVAGVLIVVVVILALVIGFTQGPGRAG